MNGSMEPTVTYCSVCVDDHKENVMHCSLDAFSLEFVFSRDILGLKKWKS